MNSSPPEICPVCGHEVPANAKACPECGADGAHGWGEDDMMGGLDLPDDDFDYEGFVKREFGSGVRPKGIKTIWWVTALILMIAVAAVFIL